MSCPTTPLDDDTTAKTVHWRAEILQPPYDGGPHLSLVLDNTNGHEGPVEAQSECYDWLPDGVGIFEVARLGLPYDDELSPDAEDGKLVGAVHIRSDGRCIVANLIDETVTVKYYGNDDV